MNKQGTKLLIIEDNEDISEIHEIAFSSEGFQVKVSPHGLDGIVKAIEFKPEVILLDLMMPQMDGFEVLSAIRKNSSMRVTIIVASNLSQKEDIDRALSLGADAYLRKSDYQPAEIVQKVKSILQEKGNIFF
jgi:DNA-binding response OmpR family regulator